jgi:1-aminocyclopropane-1-carboxylate deaminase/D-cysteine desulfhydrase-like pyridoxal-dependent ACC family enzyme
MIKLAMMPTPIAPWALMLEVVRPHTTGVFDGRVMIKRDDMTGCTLTGNKVCCVLDSPKSR